MYAFYITLWRKRYKVLLYNAKWLYTLIILFILKIFLKNYNKDNMWRIAHYLVVQGNKRHFKSSIQQARVPTFGEFALRLRILTVLGKCEEMPILGNELGSRFKDLSQFPPSPSHATTSTTTTFTTTTITTTTSTTYHFFYYYFYYYFYYNYYYYY